MIDVPEEYKNLVFPIRQLSRTEKIELDIIIKNQYNYVHVDFLYETIGTGKETRTEIHYVLVFENEEDALSFKLKYGDKYV